MEQKTHYADDATLEYLLRIEREREELRAELDRLCCMLESAMNDGISMPGIATTNRLRALLARIDK